MPETSPVIPASCLRCHAQVWVADFERWHVDQAPLAFDLEGEGAGSVLMFHNLAHDDVRSCRKCGCTDLDCRGCIERTGVPCHWVEKDLCSACEE